ncbi:phosphatase PAP2 family protein [Pontibacter sp. KCTC 32443]|uniref:phosphatase PAP2 family protein n=1 Tax=Pontibacter TaxID=323449 RepID=UPI00164D6CE0|nr:MULTISPECIES: phosphatase PAP2 family protein [Pontibacter]MBC5773422.1 phosphatase PAP2 family protein [Pontibacter sp. KCTC 32443]
MLEKLIELDKELFVYLNDMQSPFWDPIMVFASDKYVWIPFYLGLIGYVIWKYKRQSIPMLLLAVLTIALADSITSGIFKPYFARLRPCHDETLSDVINLVAGCGGKFGFMSSHAANAFGFAVFFNLILSDRYTIFKVILVAWAVIVSYSRIYLGVHFPGDVVGGAIVGSFAAYVCSLGYAIIIKKYSWFAVR